MPSQAVLLGSLTVPGEPAHLHRARGFVADKLNDGHACSEIAVLLTSELVTNSVQHSNSSHPGGTVTIALIAIPGGDIRVEVIDDGRATVPALNPAPPELLELTERGRGLHLVDTLSAQWGYYCDTEGTVTWFELAEQPSSGRSGHA